MHVLRSTHESPKGPTHADVSLTLLGSCRRARMARQVYLRARTVKPSCALRTGASELTRGDLQKSPTGRHWVRARDRRFGDGRRGGSKRRLTG